MARGSNREGHYRYGEFTHGDGAMEYGPIFSEGGRISSFIRPAPEGTHEEGRDEEFDVGVIRSMLLLVSAIDTALEAPPGPTPAPSLETTECSVPADD